MKKKFVILTIPHNCRSKKKIYCDKIAKENAIKLSDELTKQNIKNKILFGDIERNILDLNRIESKNSKFHKKLNILVKKNKLKKDLIVLDIHSGYFQDQSQIKLLNNQKLRDNNLNNNLKKDLNLKNSDIFIASNENFITNKLLNQGVKSTIIEFNENSKLKGIHKKIANSIKKL